MDKRDHLELSETRNKLLEEIKFLNFEEFNTKSDNDAWSVAEICHHLFLAESLFTRAIRYGLKRDDHKRTERKSLQFVLDRTKKIEAPEMVKPNGEAIEIKKIIELLSESRNGLLAVLDTVTDRSILAEKSAEHPIFGELTLEQWIELLYLHEQRHIEQIKDLKHNSNS